MPRHVHALQPLAGLLVVAVLVLSGCGQQTPRGEQAPRGEIAQRHQTETPLSETPSPEPPSHEPAAEPGVKVARAENDARQQPRPPQRPEPPAPLPAAKAPLPLDNVDDEDLTMPTVSLTEGHAATCRVGVGDPFPEIEAASLDGQKQPVSKLFGEKLTLVVFWNAKQPTAQEELADFTRYVLPRFSDQGLAVVAINTGDDAQLAGELARQAEAPYPVLSDAEGAAFQQVATAKTPRTYLLDPQGKIVWFDMEYSPTTRRDMVQAIRYSLTR